MNLKGILTERTCGIVLALTLRRGRGDLKICAYLRPTGLYCNWGLNRGMKLIIHKFKVFFLMFRNVSRLVVDN